LSINIFQRSMFGTSQFNRDITGWDVSSVTNFVSILLSSVKMFFLYNVLITSIVLLFLSLNMFQDSMFLWANQFNQDISGWNVSSSYGSDFVRTIFEIVFKCSLFDKRH